MNKARPIQGDRLGLPERLGKVVCRKINRERQALCSDTWRKRRRGRGKRHIEIETMQFEGRLLKGQVTTWVTEPSAHTAWNCTKPGVCTKWVHFDYIYICRSFFGQGGGVVECPGGRSLCSRLSFPLHAFKHQRQRWRESKRGRNGALAPAAVCCLVCVFDSIVLLAFVGLYDAACRHYL